MLMLRRRLQETEAAMERIVKKVGMVPFKSEFQVGPRSSSDSDISKLFLFFTVLFDLIFFTPLIRLLVSWL